MLWLRDHDLGNEIHQTEELRRSITVIFEIYLARMDCIIPNDPDNIECLLNLDGQPFPH